MEFIVRDHPILAQIRAVFNGQDTSSWNVVALDPHIGSITCLSLGPNNDFEFEGGQPKTFKKYGIVKIELPKKSTPERRREVFDALPGALKPYVIR